MAEHDQTFETFQTWVNKASSWLTRYEGKAICFDAKGRHCQNGGDFMRARDEEAFPVRWLWDWEVGCLVAMAGGYMDVLPGSGWANVVRALREEAERVDA